MRLALLRTLSKAEQKKELIKAIARIRKARIKMETLGDWTFPKDFQKRLKSCETIQIWKAK